MPLRLQIVTAERVVFDSDVDYVTAPGAEGSLGILPRHAPLLSGLTPGELRYRRSGEQVALAIGGGFIEIFNNKVVVLADSAERSDEIDVARAEEARKRAERLLSERGKLSADDALRTELALRRALTRIEVARRHGGRGGVPSRLSLED
jgi:F-type H+-transporting ATPase subunit epsilon